MSIKKVLRILILLVSLLVIFVVSCNVWVVYSTKDRVHFSQENIPSNRVALVLGTSKRTIDGGENEYFTKRIQAAVQLFEAGKVSHILVSGDNRTDYYNEPKDMYLALKELGIPDSSITLDFAGLRTLDSVIRCIKIFGQKRFTIVSQEFHGYRALFIADAKEADAIVFAAPDPEGLNSRVSLREIVARSLAVIDLYVINKQPRFMGEKEDI